MPKTLELLMPAGNTTSLHAAIEGGADAVYLGLKQFSARGRANNFTWQELSSAVEAAHERGVKVYLALNTVVKNSELVELVRLLDIASQCGVDALIIQDWGVYFLVRRYFPALALHASTQMGNHNSLGVVFSRQAGFRRVVLARELTRSELEAIAGKSPIPLEVFVHGALCYSFSGMCLFSSYIGGHSANRGMCAQPCRHRYASTNRTFPFFSLKDNQQVANLEAFKQWKIASVKVEGRMKPAGYVYRVAKAYRLALDHPERIQDAKRMLELDLGRPKTGYFFEKDLAHAVFEDTATGMPIGRVERVENSYFYVKTEFELKPGHRIRVQALGRDSRLTLTLSGFRLKNGLYRIKAEKGGASVGDRVYLIGVAEKHFPEKLKPSSTRINQPDRKAMQKIVDGLHFDKPPLEPEKIYLRINTPQWLKHIRINDLEGLFLCFTKRGWAGFYADFDFVQANREKLYAELPGFIPEASIGFYRDLLKFLDLHGIKGCVVSQLSQMLLVPNGWRIISNEAVYTFNDAAVHAVMEAGATNVVYPLENDFDNMKAGSHRNGIVPVYFYPVLFYSRMPVKLSSKGFFLNEEQKKFRLVRKDGMTLVIPDRPVSIMQNKKQLMAEGYHRFLIDVGFDNPSKNRYKTLISKLRASEQLHPSTGFNFRAQLK